MDEFHALHRYLHQERQVPSPCPSILLWNHDDHLDSSLDLIQRRRAKE